MMDVGAGPLEPVAPAVAASPSVDAVAVAPEVAVETEVRYVGLATRVISFAIDAAVIDVVAVIVGVGASLILSLVHLPGPVKTILVVIGGVAFVVWAVGYFVVFWSATGQTPGARLMQIRVVTANGTQLKPRRAFVRCVGVLLAALPLFLGFALILFDDKRRGFQDRFARTLVIEATQQSLAEVRREAVRASYEASRRRPPAQPG